MYYIIIRYSNQCFAKQSYLFSSFFFLIFSLETTILEKSEKKIEKSEENKKKRQSSVENCRFFLVEVTGFEPTASTSRTWRSTKLSHTSILLNIIYTIRLTATHYTTASGRCQPKLFDTRVFRAFVFFLKIFDYFSSLRYNINVNNCFFCGVKRRSRPRGRYL